MNCAKVVVSRKNRLGDSLHASARGDTSPEPARDPFCPSSQTSVHSQQPAKRRR